MFGLIVAGRLVDTGAVQTDMNKFMFSVPNSESVNHFVVFLLGSEPIIEGHAAAIYVGWPAEDGVNWNLAGFVSNEKPSAIFKLGKPRADTSAESQPFFAVPQLADDAMAASTIQIGVAIEPIESLAQQTPASTYTAPTLSDLALFSQKMVEHLYNFAASFTTSQAEAGRQVAMGESFFPISALTRWHQTILQRLSYDPYFWRTLSSD
eukprot:m.183458 g.183458  ORF g.183458 m.183458 type:complete len:208 (-) comp53499_c0_seq1:192-815(-)